MRWITREHVKVDRVACSWLIRHFIDPEAAFVFVPVDQVLAIAEQEGAIPSRSPTSVTSRTPFSWRWCSDGLKPWRPVRTRTTDASSTTGWTLACRAALANQRVKQTHARHA
jgi:Chromate resistance exported protein